MIDQTAISQVIETAITNRVFPGAVLGYQIANQPAVILPFGRFGYQNDSPVVSADTVYDVASVTKSIPTSSIIISLIQAGSLSLDDQAIKYLPELKNQYRAEILIRHLLTYTVVPDVEQSLSSYAPAGAQAVLKAVFETPLQARPGEKYHYLNAPAVMLGLIAERVSGRSLDALAEEMFFEPLAMSRTTFRPKTKFAPEEIAPTEIDWRGELRGEIHDEAAWALSQTGMVPGNAGLFSTAGDLLKFMRLLTEGGKQAGRTYFEPEYLKMMSTNQIDPTVGKTGLGFETDWSNLRDLREGERLIGKTGFTGCLVLAELNNQTSMVLLSNRTYPHRPENPKAMNNVRRAVIPLIFK